VTPSPHNEKLERALLLAKQRSEAKKKQQEGSANTTTFNNADLPEVSPEWENAAPQLDTADQEKVELIEDENSFIKSLNIRTVYTKLTGENPGQEGKRESIMVRCVSPSHIDENPSAWLNDSHGFFNCATCEYNTGVVGMVAASLGYNPNKGQLRGSEFKEAKEKLFKMFNYQTVEQLKEQIIQSRFKEEEPIESPESQPVNETLPVAKPKSKSNLTLLPQPPSLDDTDPDTELEEILPALPKILDTLPSGTFLHEYITAGNTSRAPNEYFLAGGLQMIAAALGPFVRGDFGGSFKLAVSVLRIGPTGNYKSMTDVAGFEVFNSGNFVWEPSYKKGDDFAEPHGIKILGNIGSGEYYLEQLSQAKVDKEVYPIRDVVCWIVNDEFSGFMTRAEAKGNTTKELFMQDESRQGVNDWIQSGSRSGGTLTAINPLRLFSSSVQTSSLRDIAGDKNVDNGFLSRMCMFGGNRKTGIRARDNKISELTQAKQKLEELRRIYHSLQCTGRENPADPRSVWKVTFTDNAADLFEKYEITLDPLKEVNGTLSRIDLHFKRLAVLMACNNLHEQVQTQDVELAWWITQYLIKTADRILGEMRKTETSEITETILTKLKNIYNKPSNGRNYMVLSSIMNACDARKTKGWEEHQYLAALETLIDAELILVTEGTAKNLPQKRYIYRDPNLENQSLGDGQKLSQPTRNRSGARIKHSPSKKQGERK